MCTCTFCTFRVIACNYCTYMYMYTCMYMYTHVCTVHVYMHAHVECTCTCTQCMYSTCTSTCIHVYMCCVECTSRVCGVYISWWRCGEGVVYSGLHSQSHIRHVQLLLACMTTVHPGILQYPCDVSCTPEQQQHNVQCTCYNILYKYTCTLYMYMYIHV